MSVATSAAPTDQAAVAAAELAGRLGLDLAATLATAPGVVRGPDPDRRLPVRDELAPLFPGGALRRGSVVQLSPSRSVTFALLSAASQQGAWCAAVGVADLGLLAAAELGVDLDRVALVPEPGPDWPVVVAALVDALDLVLLRPPGQVRQQDRRRLTARLRERGAVLLVDGTWPGADLSLQVRRTTCLGLGSGHGRLTGYALAVESRGRGGDGRPRRVDLRWGTAVAAVPAAVPAPAPTARVDAA